MENHNLINYSLWHPDHQESYFSEDLIGFREDNFKKIVKT